MGLPDRFTIAKGGPRQGTCWDDEGDSFTLQNHATISATTTVPGLFAAQTVTRPNPFIAAGNVVESILETVDATQIIQTLYGFQVTASVLQAALTNLTLTLSVYRTVGQQSGAGASGTTSLPLKLALTGAIPSGSTLTITKVDGSASTTVTTSAAAARGDTSIAVTSVNLTGYADGSNLSWQVGNNPAFGWIGGSGGTPAFPVGVSVVSPAVAANTSLITSGAVAWPSPNGVTAANAAGIPVQWGDSLMLNCVTSSSTATVQVLNIQPLLS